MCCSTVLLLVTDCCQFHTDSMRWDLIGHLYFKTFMLSEDLSPKVSVCNGLKVQCASVLYLTVAVGLWNYFWISDADI